jgi:DNA-binding LacI/PurR family transcriptional regulator
MRTDTLGVAAAVDDGELARSARLATLRQPLHALGRRAVELLLARIVARHDQDPVPDDLVLPTELVFSHTLAQPRAGSLVVA